MVVDQFQLTVHSNKQYSSDGTSHVLAVCLFAAPAHVAGDISFDCHFITFDSSGGNRIEMIANTNSLLALLTYVELEG